MSETNNQSNAAETTKGSTSEELSNLQQAVGESDDVKKHEEQRNALKGIVESPGNPEVQKVFANVYDKFEEEVKNGIEDFMNKLDSKWGKLLSVFSVFLFGTDKFEGQDRDSEDIKNLQDVNANTADIKDIYNYDDGNFDNSQSIQFRGRACIKKTVNGKVYLIDNGDYGEAKDSLSNGRPIAAAPVMYLVYSDPNKRPCTLCSKTARETIQHLLPGVKVESGNAIDVQERHEEEDSLKENVLFSSAKWDIPSYGSSKEIQSVKFQDRLQSMEDAILNSKDEVFDAFSTSSSRFGHRFVIVKNSNNEILVLDPYYKSGGDRERTGVPFREYCEKRKQEEGRDITLIAAVSSKEKNIS